MSENPGIRPLLPPPENPPKRKRGRPKKEKPELIAIKVDPPVALTGTAVKWGADDFGQIASVTVERPDPPPPEDPDAAAHKIAQSLGLPRVGNFYRVVGTRFVLGAAGMARLALESGELRHLDARAVWDRDTFMLDYANGVISHAPYDGPDAAGILNGAYAVALTVEGQRHVAYVPARDVPRRAGLTEGMTAEEAFRKVALLELVATSPLTLEKLRLAILMENS